MYIKLGLYVPSCNRNVYEGPSKADNYQLCFNIASTPERTQTLILRINSRNLIITSIGKSRVLSAGVSHSAPTGPFPCYTRCNTRFNQIFSAN